MATFIATLENDRKEAVLVITASSIPTAIDLLRQSPVYKQHFNDTTTIKQIAELRSDIFTAVIQSKPSKE